MDRRIIPIHIFCLLASFVLINCKTDPKSKDSYKDQYFKEYESPAHKWGYINKAGEIKIKARYDEVRPFTQGLAAVNHKGKWGYIDKKGNWSINAQFLAAYPFRDSLAKYIGFNGLMGLIDLSGKIVIPPVLHDITSIENGLLVYNSNGKKGLIRIGEGLLLDNAYEHIQILNAERVAIRSDGHYKIINLRDEVIADNLEAVKSGFRVKKDNLWGILDVDGRWLLPNAYKRIRIADEKHWIAQNEAGWVLVDKANATRSEYYERIKYLGARRYAALKEEGWILLDESGSPLNNKAMQAIYAYSDQRAAFQENDLWGYMDEYGIIQIQPTYFLPWNCLEGMIRVIDSNGFHFVDKNGNVIVRLAFRDVRDFSEGLAAFQK